MKSRRYCQEIVLTTFSILTFGGCVDQPVPTAPGPLAAHAKPAQSIQGGSSHVVLFEAEEVPIDFEQRVSRLNGSVDKMLGVIGVALVSGLSPAAAAALASEPGIRAVERNATMPVTHDYDEVFNEADDILARRSSVASIDATSTLSPMTAPLYPRQWNMRAVSALEAWTAGHLGSRAVVVAILDTGIDYLHPDLAGLVDVARSKSFVPEDNAVIATQYPGRLPISDLHGHGTVAASIVGSNAAVVAGINRHVTLLAVKVWDSTAQGPIDRLLSGIVYAADQGADVINISGSYTLDRSEQHGLAKAVHRAVNYAFRNGAIVVAIAGNDAADLDRIGNAMRVPCETANVICASGTAPTGVSGITGPWENVDASAPYTAIGRSAVDVAAPSGFGDFANPSPLIGQFRRIWAPCTTTPTATSLPACARGMPLAQSFGTSWAAPHVSGLAALLVAQRGHDRPGQIHARILESADDLGVPGTDPYYGHGRINIARALGVIPRSDRDRADRNDDR